MWWKFNEICWENFHNKTYITFFIVISLFFLLCAWHSMGEVDVVCLHEWDPCGLQRIEKVTVGTFGAKRNFLDSEEKIGIRPNFLNFSNFFQFFLHFMIFFL